MSPIQILITTIISFFVLFFISWSLSVMPAKWSILKENLLFKYAMFISGCIFANFFVHRNDYDLFTLVLTLIIEIYSVVFMHETLDECNKKRKELDLLKETANFKKIEEFEYYSLTHLVYIIIRQLFEFLITIIAAVTPILLYSSKVNESTVLTELLTNLSNLTLYLQLLLLLPPLCFILFILFVPSDVYIIYSSDKQRKNIATALLKRFKT